MNQTVRQLTDRSHDNDHFSFFWGVVFFSVGEGGVFFLGGFFFFFVWVLVFGCVWVCFVAKGLVTL